MKKLFLLSLAALALSVNAGAQVFNHLSLGVGGGTDGLSFELAAPLGGHVQLRAGYGTAVGLIGYTYSEFSLPEHPGNSESASVKTPVKASLAMSDARLLFNIYPGKGGFHFTVGAYMGASSFVKATLQNLPSDYSSVGLNVDGYLVKAQNGQITALAAAPGFGSYDFAVKPYVGIGFGRPVRDDRRVTFSFDLGAQYQGKLALLADGEGLTGSTKRVDLSGIEDLDLKESIEEAGKYTAFWPTLQFHLYVKLF